MVQYKVKDDYFQGVLKTLNNLRTSKEFYDIILTVGDRQICAHKNILISGSDYFKTMFVGSYKEAKMGEIDLTATSSDSETLDNIVNFLYTGEVEINFENFGPLMKLASAFLVSKLSDFCTEFFLENIKFETYLDFYFCAVEHRLVELEEKVEILVKSRFHDKLIFLDEMLNLTPQEMAQIFRIGCFQHCSGYDTLMFLIDWLECKLSESSLSVANDILASVEMEVQELTKDQTDFLADVFDKLSVNKDLRVVDGGKQFLTKVEELRNPCKKIAALHTGYRLRSKVKNTQGVNPSLKDLIITICPEHHVVEELLIDPYGDPFAGYLEGSVLDVCAYDTKSKVWYYLFCLDDTGISDGLLRLISLPTWEYVYKDNEVFCVPAIDSEWKYVERYEMTGFEFSYVGDYDLDFPDPELVRCGNCSTRLVSAGQNVYSVYLLRLYERGDACTKSYCFRVHRLESDGRAILLFETSRLQYHCHGYHASGVSSTSGEMIIVYYLRNDLILQIYVADLNADKPDPHQLYSVEDSQTLERKRKNMEIVVLPGKDRFYIIEVLEEQNRSKMSCRFEYVYHSGAVTQSNVSSMYVKNSFEKDKNYAPPVFYNVIKVDNGSVWIFGGNREGASSLSEVTVNEPGQFCVIEHKPPPFSCITGMFAAQVPAEYLSGKKVVRKFRQGIPPREPKEDD